jgi:hypothetical protein
MTRKSMWFTILSIGGAAAVVSGAWIVSNLMSCKYSESSPTYSADQKFYYQMQFTLCADRAKSRVRLLMGVAGRSDKYELLELGPRLGEMNLSWHEGPKLLVQVPHSAIIERFGPYAELPQIEISNP